MLVLRNQNRILLGVLLLLLLLLVGGAAAWVRLEVERQEPPIGALLVRERSPAGA